MDVTLFVSYLRYLLATGKKTAWSNISDGSAGVSRILPDSYWQLQFSARPGAMNIALCLMSFSSFSWRRRSCLDLIHGVWWLKHMYIHDYSYMYIFIYMQYLRLISSEWFGASHFWMNSVGSLQDPRLDRYKKVWSNWTIGVNFNGGW